MANDVYELRVFYANADGKRAQNVMHWEASTPPVSSDVFVVAGLIASGFSGANMTALRACLGSDTQVVALACKRVNNGGGPTATLLINQPGTVDSQCISMLVSECLTLIQSAAPFNRKLGKIFVPAVPETFVTTDVLMAAGYTAYGAYTTALLGPIMESGSAFNLGIYDRTSHLFTNISDIRIRLTVSGLRRRGRIALT